MINFVVTNRLNFKMNYIINFFFNVSIVY